MLSTSSLRWLHNARGIRLGRWTTGDVCGSKCMEHSPGNSQIPLKTSANSSKTGTSIYVSVTDSTSLMGPKLMHPFRPVMGCSCVDYIKSSQCLCACISGHILPPGFHHHSQMGWHVGCRVHWVFSFAYLYRWNEVGWGSSVHLELGFKLFWTYFNVLKCFFCVWALSAQCHRINIQFITLLNLVWPSLLIEWAVFSQLKWQAFAKWLSFSHILHIFPLAGQWDWSVWGLFPQ